MGWEILIAIFGSLWYVVSAIAAAKEKKKKQAKRQAAMAAEAPMSESGQTSSGPIEADLPVPRDVLTTYRREKQVSVGDAAQLQVATPAAPASLSSTGAAPVKAGTLHAARQAIIEAMRKEMGLPATGSTTTPTAAGSALKVPSPPARVQRPRPEERTRSQPTQRPTTDPVDVAYQRPSGRAVAKPVTTADIRSLLNSPGNLRRAIALTEILGPPVAMRD